MFGRKSILAAFLIFSALALFACKSQNDADMEKENMEAMHSDPQLSSGLMRMDSTTIRRGTIDLAQVDENHDGKVYECPMDWNVLADSAGYCPMCNMEMKEYSVADAKMNLKENGYEVK